MSEDGRRFFSRLVVSIPLRQYGIIFGYDSNYRLADAKKSVYSFVIMGYYKILPILTLDCIHHWTSNLAPCDVALDIGSTVDCYRSDGNNGSD